LRHAIEFARSKIGGDGSMLTLLNVPKGTRLFSVGFASSYDCNVQLAALAPSVGSFLKPGNTIYTREGFLHESTGILGQNPVEHLKLSGSLVDMSFSNGTTDLNAGGKPSYAGVPWINIPVSTNADGTGTLSTLQVQFTVPYMDSLSCSAKRTIPSGSLMGKLYALHVIVGWCAEDTFFTAYKSVLETTLPGTDGWSVIFNISVTKLGPTRTTVGGGTGTIQFLSTVNPVFVDPAEWVDAVVAKASILAQTITTYGYSYATTYGPCYTRNTPAASPSIPQFEAFEGKFFPQDLSPDRWGDLASDCYSQIKCWDGNAAAYLRDSVMSVRAAKDTVALARSLIGSKNPVTIAKSLASLFLSFRYGWCLQAKDTASLIALDFDRAYPHGLAKRSASRTYERNGVPVVARMGVYFQPYSTKISELAGFLRSIDLDLTLENIWDLVPLSFVVDWFTGFGDLLDRMDQMSEVDSYDIRQTGLSVKTTKSLIYRQTSGRTDWHGRISATYYKRSYLALPIQPSLTSYRTSNQKFDHWLEGTALVVQRL